MLQSNLFYFPTREFPANEESINAKYLIKAGYVVKTSTGVYSFLPLGLKVLEKIANLVRKEMFTLGAQEILMPALHPKDLWVKTGRWEKFDALFRLKSRTDSWYALGPTHEEIIFPLVKRKINSYKDLPLALFQIQTKFRDELRAKSGLLRGREFLMKDLYSFHQTSDEVEKYKEKVEKSYQRIFKKLNLKVFKVLASGGTFSKYSVEFQVPCQYGEDEIKYCSNCNLAWNVEIQKNKNCPQCQNQLSLFKTIEVANTFNLGTKFSEFFDVKFKDKNGKENFVFAGCYGLGISRLLGTLVEVFHDDYGLCWPPIVSPFLVHLLILKTKIDKKEIEKFEKLFNSLNIDYLIDDRQINFGEKLVESDLLGISYRLVISEKLKDKIEFKERFTKKIKIVSFSELKNIFEKIKRENEL